MYGGVWHNPLYDGAGLPTLDNNTPATNVGESNLCLVGAQCVNQGKWYGFFGGIGKLFRWPAVRQGGVQPALNRTVYIPFRLANVTGAAEVAIVLTQPAGTVTTTVCTTSPCAVTMDARQGSHLMQMNYRSSGHAVLASGAAIPVTVN